MKIQAFVLGSAILFGASTASAEAVQVRWTRNLPGCASDASVLADDGTLYVACNDFNEGDVRVVALDKKGQIARETRAFGNPGTGHAAAYSLALDETRGVLYVAGLTTSEGNNDAQHGAVSALSTADLKPRFTQRFEDGFPVYGVASGADGSVYGVTRTGDGEQSTLEVFRLGTDGSVLFRAFANAGEGISSGFENIVVAQNGAAYVAAHNAVVKVSATGQVEWTVALKALKVALRPDGNVLATTPLLPSGTTTLLSPEGRVLFRASVGGLDLLTNAANDTWVLRTDYKTDNNSDWVLARLDPQGNVRWSARYGDVRQDTATGLALDFDDNAYLTGMATVRGGLFNMFYTLHARLVKIDAQGKQSFETEVPNTSLPSDVHVDVDQTILVPGLESTSAFTPKKTNSCPSWWPLCR